MNAIEHNLPENVNNWLGDLNNVYKYLSGGRLQWYGEVIEAFIKNAGVDFAGKKIADVGCAAGNALRYIHDKHSPGSLTGFDRSSKVLRWARYLLPDATFKTHDIEKPLKMKFDIILSLQVLEHLNHPKRALSNLMDALNAGGMLLLTVPDGMTDGWVGHINRWTMKEFVEFTGAQHMGHLDDVLMVAVEKKK